MIKEANEEKKSPVLESLSAFSVPYAKIPYDQMRRFGCGKLNLSGKAFDVLMAISPYVDHDNRIVISLNEIRERLSMQRAEFFQVLETLQQQKFILEKQGGYYSGFHIQAKGAQGESSYAKLYKAYFSSVFRSWSLNRKRLFVHIVNFTSRDENAGFTVPLERLYNNATTKNSALKSAITYLYTFNELADHLTAMIEQGTIRIQLLGVKQNGTVQNADRILDAETKNIKDKLRRFYGYDEQVRVSSKKAQHLVRIKLVKHPHKPGNHIKVQASQFELVELAEKNGLTQELLDIDQINNIISYKKELVARVGKKGLDLYRNALVRFFEEKSLEISWYSRFKKMANFFMDFYLMENVQAVLQKAARTVLDNTLTAGQDEIEWSKQEIEQLLEFFRIRASDGRVVQLDEGIEKITADLSLENGYYEELATCSPEWKTLYEVTSTIYTINYEPFRGAVSMWEWTEKVRSWAKEGVLVQKKKFEKAIEQVKEKVFAVDYFFMRSLPLLIDNPVSASGVTRSEQAVPFFNWLADDTN